MPAAALSVLVAAASVPGSVEFVVECESDGSSPRFVAAPEEPPDDEGALEWSATQGGVSVWTGTVQVGTGECRVLVRVLDTDGERMCVANEPLPAASDLPDDLYLEVDCPLGRIDPGPPPGDLIISAQTLAEPGLSSVQSVSYSMTCDLDSHLEIQFNGSLAAVGLGTAQLGGETVETNEWEFRLENTGPGVCELELTTLDGEGIAVCSFEESLEVVSSAVTKLRAVLFCG